MRTTTARRLPSLSGLPLLLLLPLLLVPMPSFKVYVDSGVPIEVEGGPGQPRQCLDDVTGIDIPDEVYSCNHTNWCTNVVFDAVNGALCLPID